MSIPNIKVAYQYLKITEQKYRKQAQEDAKANTDYAVQQNSGAAQAKAQAEAQLIQIKETLRKDALLAQEEMKGVMAQQTKILEEILKSNSMLEQKILEQVPLASVMAAQQQQMAQEQAMMQQQMGGGEEQMSEEEMMMQQQGGQVEEEDDMFQQG